jgi:lysozyme
MTINKEGKELIKKYEGFRNHPYKCPANIPTIGYGFTHYGNGESVSMSDEPINKKDADILLDEILEEYEDAVRRNVTAEINQNQFDALVSFTFNLGEGNLKRSTLLKKVNANPDDPSIAYEFKRWNKAGGRVLKGLKKRRNEEAYLYFNKD